LIAGLAAGPAVSAEVGGPLAAQYPVIAVHVPADVTVPEPPADPSFGVVVAPGVIPAPLDDASADANAPASDAENESTPLEATLVETAATPSAETPAAASVVADSGLADTGLPGWPIAISGVLALCGACAIGTAKSVEER